MNILSYKKGYSALRKIINDDEADYVRHFAKFHFVMGERYSERAQLKGIYNLKTNNVIAFVNRKGNVFMRPNSIYADHLLESKNKVLMHNNLRDLRGKVPSHVKSGAVSNNLAETAVDRLILNDDEPNKVFLFSIKADGRFDERFVMKRIKQLLKPLDTSNTLYALENNRLIAEEVLRQDKYKIYLQIDDYSEAIAEKKRVERVKKEVSEAFYSNIREIAENSITSGHSLNPMQFTYTDSEGVEVTGVIKLHRLDMNYPREMAIGDWLRPENIAQVIEFRDRIGSLESRGIDEMAIRAEREAADERRMRQMEAEARMYEEMARIHPGSVNIMPRMSYNNTTWHTGVDTSENPFGTGVVMHHYVDEAQNIDRATLEELSAVDISSWDVAETMLQDYPTEPDQPMSSA